MIICHIRHQQKRYAPRYSSRLPNLPLRDTYQLIQTKYTINLLDEHNYYHSEVIRSKLIRHIPTIFRDVYDELLLAFNDCIPTVGEGMWQICG